MTIRIFILLFFWAMTAYAQQPFEYDDHDKRDPFWNLVLTGGSIENYETDFLVSDLNLEGIVAGSDGGNVAIINGRIVKAGDTVGNFVVKEIKKDSVVLNNDQEKFELRLKKED